MIILGIETSCDETALAILTATGGLTAPKFSVLADVVRSQIDTHAKFGGVFPTLAKREHADNLIPLFKKLLDEARLLKTNTKPTISNDHKKVLSETLAREPELLEQFLSFIPTIQKPDVDMIAVTHGPGLEPALWVGINFARALGSYFDIPVIPTNHMEGHIYSVLLTAGVTPESIRFPLLALLVSGGHTELILATDWLLYKRLGETRDDAVGEAFDKVARILGLPYPGGPKISLLAEEAREKNISSPFVLPRPMIGSNNYDFSFSGLKTAALYNVQKLGLLSDTQKAGIAREFEDAAIAVLVKKTTRALAEFGAKTLVIGGGVVANQYLRESFQAIMKDFPNTTLLLPELKHSTDNAVMIAVAGYLRSTATAGLSGEKLNTLSADGTLSVTARLLDR